MKAITFTKRIKIITTVAIAATLATGGGYVAHQNNVEAQAIRTAKVEKLKADDNKERKAVQIIKDKFTTTDRAGLAKLKEEAKKVKDPARKSNLDKASKEATVRLDKADKVAAEKKAADAKKAEEVKKAAESQKAAEAAAAEQAAEQAAKEQAQAAEKPADNAETAASTQASAPAQQASPAPETAPATPSAPSYSIAGYSSVAIANSQTFIDNSRYSWISLSDVPTAGGIALLGHADAAGTWVAGANVGDIVTVSGVAYQIYNKYAVGWNSPGEWDAIQSCGSGEVSIITCTDASGQSDWVLRAKRV